MKDQCCADRWNYEAPSNEKIDMGMGRLKDPRNHFAKKNLFLLRSQIGYALPPECVSSVRIDHHASLLHVNVLHVAIKDTIQFPSLRWNKGSKLGNLDLTTYTGSGIPLYTIRFLGCEVTSKDCVYDTARSSIASDDVRIRFSSHVVFISRIDPQQEDIPSPCCESQEKPASKEVEPPASCCGAKEACEDGPSEGCCREENVVSPNELYAALLSKVQDGIALIDDVRKSLIKYTMKKDV